MELPLEIALIMFEVVIGLFPQYDTIEIKSASTDLLAILYGLFSERFPQK